MDEVSTQNENYWRDMEGSLRRKEKIVEDGLSKLGENCLAGSFLGSERQNAQELLPGIPNEITLDLITTKLSWTEVHVLQLVSRGWYNAIRNHSVYDARVRSQSTETFVFGSTFDSLDLHSLRGNSCFELPRIPDESPWSSRKFFAVDGRVYVLGGLFDGASDKVYMLDLAGKRPWTQVASMQTARRNFGCGVVDGKIYVFGGISHLSRPLRESEVYEPKENRWSSITPMSCLSCCLKVATVGEELFLYAGVLIDGLRREISNFLEIYSPAKDEWRKVEPFAQPPGIEIFLLGGKVCSLDDLGIHMYSFDANSWTQVGSHSFTAIEQPLSFWPSSVLIAAEDDLLVYGFLSNDYVLGAPPRGPSVLRSIGLDTEKQEVSWREERTWDLDEISDLMCHIHL